MGAGLRAQSYLIRVPCEPGLVGNGWDGWVHQGVGFDEWQGFIREIDGGFISSQDHALHNSQAWKENSFPPHNLYLGKRCLFWKKTLREEGEWITFPKNSVGLHIQASVTVTEFLSAGPKGDSFLEREGGPAASGGCMLPSDQRALVKDRNPFCLYCVPTLALVLCLRDRCPNRIWSFLF